MRRDATEALGSVIFALIATDTARVSVRPSVSLAVCPISRRSRDLRGGFAATLWTRTAGDVDRQRRASDAEMYMGWVHPRVALD